MKKITIRTLNGFSETEINERLNAITTLMRTLGANVTESTIETTVYDDEEGKLIATFDEQAEAGIVAVLESFDELSFRITEMNEDAPNTIRINIRSVHGDVENQPVTPVTFANGSYYTTEGSMITSFSALVEGETYIVSVKTTGNLK